MLRFWRQCLLGDARVVDEIITTSAAYFLSSRMRLQILDHIRGIEKKNEDVYCTLAHAHHRGTCNGGYVSRLL